MGSALYSGATGMENEQTNLDVIANNLANMSTPGFKKIEAEFADLLYQSVKSSGADSGNGEAAPTGIEIGNGSQLVGTTKIFTQGSLHQTDNQLDLAIEGDGFFEVTRPDGTTAYTRAGNLKINSAGQITTSTGYPLAGGAGTIPTGGKIAISRNGQVTVSLNGHNVGSFRLQLANFPNPAGLESIGNSLLRESSSSGSPQVGNPQDQGFGGIIQGFVERSNVSAVEEMVKLIIAQRAIEMNSKSIQSADEALGVYNQLKRH